MRKYYSKKFTLIELLAAMAVFSIMLMISIRLFSGAQGLWLRSEQKTAAFANARVAMEFVASRLQSNVYYENVPFCIFNNSDSDQLLFVSRMPLGSSGSNRLSSLRFFQFSLIDPTDSNNTNAGTLQLRIFSGRGKKKYSWVFPPYDDENRYFKNPGDAFDYVHDALNDTNTEDDTVVDVIENVIGINFECYKSVFESSSWKLEKHDYTSGNHLKTPPYLVEVEIMMLDSEESFKKWQEAGTAAKKKEVFAEFGYTFRRAVLLGKK